MTPRGIPLPHGRRPKNQVQLDLFKTEKESFAAMRKQASRARRNLLSNKQLSFLARRHLAERADPIIKQLISQRAISSGLDERNGQTGGRYAKELEASGKIETGLEEELHALGIDNPDQIRTAIADQLAKEVDDEIQALNFGQAKLYARWLKRTSKQFPADELHAKFNALILSKSRALKDA